MKILVTGGAGFIGSHTVRLLLGRGDEVITVDDFNDFYAPARKEKNVVDFLENPSFKLYRGDIRDFTTLKEIFEKEKPDKIVHLAARAGVRPSIRDPLLYEEVNVKGTLNLLELAKDFAVENFVFGSSSSVYGENKKIPFSEEDRVDNPISPYAATKKAGELLCHTYHHLYKLPITGLRFFTVYGPGGRPDMAPYLFTDWIHNGKAIKRFGDGTSKRDYTYVGDIVAGILAALDKNLDYEIINLGNNQTVELSRLIEVIEKLLGKKAEIEELPEQPGDVPITYADIGKAQKLLNYAPGVKIEEGMEKFVNWYLKTLS